MALPGVAAPLRYPRSMTVTPSAPAAPTVRPVEPSDVAGVIALVTVVLAEFVPRHWWEWLLHSQTATRLKTALLFRPNTIIIDVPYHFEDTADLARRRG